MYQPPQRDILCNFLTPAGWIRGKIVLPKAQALREFLETSKAGYLKLRDAELATGKVPFLALLRDSVSLIVPSPDSERLNSGNGDSNQSRRISCLMTAGVLDGNITLKMGSRMTDHLELRNSFLFLELCVLHAGPHSSTLPVALANVKQIIGVADASEMP